MPKVWITVGEGEQARHVQIQVDRDTRKDTPTDTRKVKVRSTPSWPDGSAAQREHLKSHGIDAPPGSMTATQREEAHNRAHGIAPARHEMSEAEKSARLREIYQRYIDQEVQPRQGNKMRP